ncbi:hypothetical protein ACPPVT_00565 [Angustibacter sp. McL0619]|uniref:hypothetical protein n=1 Tax=Angustibacter sp. McL0619 TaxID=3415676 RepID=UPI003CF5D32C
MPHFSGPGGRRSGYASIREAIMIKGRTRLAAAGGMLAAVALLAACGSDNTGTKPSAGSTPTSSSTEDPSMSSTGVEQMAASVVGMSEDDALKAISDAGLTSRVVARDGEEFPVTMDLQPDRINLTIDDAKVTKATVG